MIDWQTIDTAPLGEVLLYFPPQPQGAYKQYTAPAMIKVGHANGYPFRMPTHWAALHAPSRVGAA